MAQPTTGLVPLAVGITPAAAKPISDTRRTPPISAAPDQDRAGSKARSDVPVTALA
jgi:hypothetical protein